MNFAQIEAAQDVLSAALLSLEAAPESSAEQLEPFAGSVQPRARARPRLPVCLVVIRVAGHGGAYRRFIDARALRDRQVVRA
jgi:hypothetical protein